MAFFTSQFTNKTLASGIKKADSHSDLVNVFHYKYEYAEDSQDFSHPPIKVNFSPPNNPEVEVDSRLKGIDTTNLNEIEQVFLQNNLPEIITITDEDETLDFQTSDNELEGESIMVDKVICQDLRGDSWEKMMLLLTSST